MSDPVHQETDTDFLWGIFPRVLRRSKTDGNVSVKGSRLNKDASHYRMDHDRRGVAAIFNQVGSAGLVGNDISSLSKTFNNLGFELEMFNDLSQTEVHQTLEELSQRDHSDCDCFALAYLTRGTEGKLRARDKVFDVNCLWACFTAERSPTLANKPKLFITQGYRDACRSKRVRFHDVCDEDQDSGPGNDRIRSYYIPDRSDFLIVMSTVQGVVGPRQTRRAGSVYIQTLCRYLDSVAFNQDMMTVLTEVNRKILDGTTDSSDSYKKQTPTIISLLIRIFQFNNKKSVSEKDDVILWEDSDNDEYEGGNEDVGVNDNYSNKKSKIDGSVRYNKLCKGNKNI